MLRKSKASALSVETETSYCILVTAIPDGPINARRLDTTLVERLKSCLMKLTQVRYFSHASIIPICCCISIAFAASAAASLFSVPDWVELSPNNPPPARSYLAMTYDPVSGKTIAFGGLDGTGYLNDTWSFDGTSWAHIATFLSCPAT